MRNVILLGLYGLFCAAVATAIRPVEAAAPVPGPQEKIVAREIVLVDEAGHARITLKAAKGDTGIWVGDHNGLPKGGLVAITYSHSIGPAIGYYAPGSKFDACDFAVGPNDGSARIQYRKKDGGLDWIDVADLKK